MWYVIFSSDEETYTKIRLILSSYGYTVDAPLGYDSISNKFNTDQKNLILASSLLLKSKKTFLITESEQRINRLTKKMYIELKIKDVLQL